MSHGWGYYGLIDFAFSSNSEIRTECLTHLELASRKAPIVPFLFWQSAGKSKDYFVRTDWTNKVWMTGGNKERRKREGKRDTPGSIIQDKAKRNNKEVRRGRIAVDVSGFRSQLPKSKKNGRKFEKSFPPRIPWQAHQGKENDSITRSREEPISIVS